MVAAARVVVVFAGLGMVAGAQVSVAPAPHLPLDTLVKEYQRLGLPLPPPDAPLVRIDWYRDEGDPAKPPIDNPYLLGFRLPPSQPGNKVRYLVGDGRVFTFYIDPRLVELVEPTPALLHRLSSGHLDELCRAVQCKLRGWNDLADALYTRARESHEEFKWDHSLWVELRHVAWRYWFDRLTQRDGDRTEVLRRFKDLAAEEPSLRDVVSNDFIRCLERTVAPRKSKPGTVESLIDDLTEYWMDDDGPLDPAGQESYWKLAERGFDAVPALIEHLADDRQSRAFAWERGTLRPYKLTVGHLCSQLLFDLSARTIGGYQPNSGVRLDPDMAREWFATAQKMGEEKWLVAHAIPVGGMIADLGGRPESLIVRVIGAKYPDRLPTVYQTMLGKPASHWLRDFVPEIVASKLPRDRKIALLVEGATHADFDHRIHALGGLAAIEQAVFRKHFLQTLKEIEAKLATVNDRSSRLYQIIRLVEQDDDRECWDAFAALAKNVPFSLRLDVVGDTGPHGEPDRRDPARRERLRFLLQFLDDRTTGLRDDGPWSAVEVRDYAASQLAGLLGVTMLDRYPSYTAIHDRTLGPLSRLVLREVVRRAATRELAGGGK